MAYFDTTWYVNFGDGSTTGYYAVAKRPQNAAVAAGQIVRQFTTPSVGGERVFVCIVAGTTANTTDATWSLSRGLKTTDGTATWQECTGASAVNGDLANTISWSAFKAAGGSPTIGMILKRNSGASYQIAFSTAGVTGASEPAFSDTAGVTTVDGGNVWTSLGPVGNFTGGGAPHARLANALASTWFTSGNTVYVGDNHAETRSSSTSYAPASALMARILCHNHSGSYPPAASDITTGATITVSGGLQTHDFTGQGSFYFYGITFASVNSNCLIGAGSVGQTQNWYYFDNCSWQAGSSILSLGATTTGWGVITFNNTTVRMGLTTTLIRPYFLKFIWQNTGQILAAGSAVPNTLFQLDTASGRFSEIVLRNLDLSQLTGSLFTNASNSSIGSLTVQDCKLNAAMTVTRPINSGMTVQLIRSDSAATAYKSSRVTYEGTEDTEVSIVRTDGAVDPTGIAQTRRTVTTANAQWLRPFKCEPMAIYNETVGSAVTVTVCGTVNSGALPNNDDIWAEFEYLGSATDPLGTIVTTTKASVLASNAAVASDSSTWVNAVAARFASSTAVNVALSNFDLTATKTTSNLDSGVRNNIYQTTGKYYFEVTVGVNHGSNDAIGIIPSGVAFGSASTGVSVTHVRFSNGIITSNNTNSGSLPAPIVQGDVIGVAVDLTARKAWLRKNGGDWNNVAIGSSNPATATGGVTILAAVEFAPYLLFSTSSASTIGDDRTANFGATAYANAAPSGFANWPSWTPFALATTITPQLPGYIHARVRVGKASATYYIDPKVTLT